MMVIKVNSCFWPRTNSFSARFLSLVHLFWNYQNIYFIISLLFIIIAAEFKGFNELNIFFPDILTLKENVLLLTLRNYWPELKI